MAGGGLMNITEYILTAIFIFLLYFAVRSGIHHNKIGGAMVGFIFILAGLFFSGIDRTLLILGGLIIIILSIFEKSEDRENE